MHSGRCTVKTRINRILLVFLSLGIGALALPGRAETNREEALRKQQQALAAFEAGHDEEAAQAIVQAEQESAGCVWVFPTLALAESLTVVCGNLPPSSGERLSAQEGAARLLFQWGQFRWEAKTRELQPTGAQRSNQHPHLFFEVLLQHYPQSRSADEAKLRLVEDGFCWKWDRYPDCPALEIMHYEQFLQAYPFSAERPRVLREMARRYQALTERYQEPAPWFNPARAELCAAMTQNLWQELIQGYPGSPEAAEARKALDQLPAERKPAIAMPKEVFEALSREAE